MTAAARGPGTFSRCLRPRPSTRACARPDRRAPGANPRAGSLSLAAGLLEWAYSRRGKRGAVGRAVRRDAPTVERGALDLVVDAGNGSRRRCRQRKYSLAEVQRSCVGRLTVSRTLPAKASPAEPPRALVHSHRGSKSPQAASAGGAVKSQD